MDKCSKGTLLVSVEGSPRVRWRDADPESITSMSCLGPPESDLVFYDWLRNSRGEICGVELHFMNDLASWLSAAERISLNADKGIFELLFLDGADLQRRGQEAFGDLFVYRDAGGVMWVAIGLNTWVSAAEADRLILFATKP